MTPSKRPRTDDPHAQCTIVALVLAAGAGNRLRPLTDLTPKCLVEIAERALLDYWIDALARARVTEIRVNTHHLAHQVRGHLHARRQDLSIQLVESYEEVLLGSAGTISANRSLADDADVVLVVYGDNMSDIDLRELVRFHTAHDDPMTMALFRAEDPTACGIVELDSEGRIVSFVEKPEHPVSDLANAGVYAMTADAYREIADLGLFDIGHDVLPRFVSRSRGFVWDGYHVDIGTHEALARVRRDAGLSASRDRRGQDE